MGGDYIYKAVLKLWWVVVVFCAFVLGTVGADLQCADSQVKAFIRSIDASKETMPAFEYWQDIQSMIAQFAKTFKNMP